MAGVVFVLCALTSLACAILLWRGYRRSQTRLLGWSAAFFLGQALHNALLFTDLYLLPRSDLSTLRVLPALLGVALLLYGLIWDDK